jgi:hypothetical protein
MEDKWAKENKKFFEIINWFTKEKEAYVNKINIGFINIDNRFIKAKDKINVKNKEKNKKLN